MRRSELLVCEGGLIAGSERLVLYTPQPGPYTEFVPTEYLPAE